MSAPSPIPNGALVSVVMPAYDAACTIRASIESVLAQTYRHWELLVVDDDSTDATVDIVAGLQADPRIRLLRTGRRSGPAGARNVALDSARGRLVAFLDSDDLWLPDKLARQTAFMQRTAASISFTSYLQVKADGRTVIQEIVAPEALTYREMLKSNRIGCLTAMFDRQAFPYARFPDMRQAAERPLPSFLVGAHVGHEDYAFWLGLMRPGDRNGPDVRALGLNAALALYRTGASSFSSNKVRAAAFQWLVYRRIERLGVLSSLYYFGHYIGRGVRKHLLPRRPPAGRSAR